MHASSFDSTESLGPWSQTDFDATAQVEAKPWLACVERWSGQVAMAVIGLGVLSVLVV